jgi:branched-chain amino acid transport system permease protein
MKTYKSRIVAGMLLLLLAILPQLLSSYHVRLVSLTLIYAIFAMSLDIILGYAGLPSLGHAACFGASAYVIAVLNAKILQGSNLVLEMPAALVSAALVAAIIGLLVVRTKGIYFLMLTLSLSMILWAIAFQWRSVTGGDDGISGIYPLRLPLIHWDLSLVVNYYYFLFLCFIIAVLLMYLLVNSPFGHVLLGIRENEVRMASMGYRVWIYKYTAFIISGGFAGLSGILFAYYNSFVTPSVLDVGTSADAIIMVILGGQGTLFGAALGAAVVVLVKYVLSTFTDRWVMILGILYVIVVILTPAGIYNMIKKYLV